MIRANPTTETTATKTVSWRHKSTSEFPQVNYDDLLPMVNEPIDDHKRYNQFYSMNASREYMKPPRHTFKPGQNRSLKFSIDTKTKVLKPRANYKTLQNDHLAKS